MIRVKETQQKPMSPDEVHIVRESKSFFVFWLIVTSATVSFMWYNYVLVTSAQHEFD